MTNCLTALSTNYMSVQDYRAIQEVIATSKEEASLDPIYADVAGLSPPRDRYCSQQNVTTQGAAAAFKPIHIN